MLNEAEVKYICTLRYRYPKEYLIKLTAHLYPNKLCFVVLVLVRGFSRVRLTLQALVPKKFKSESLRWDVQGQLIFKLVDFTVVATITMTNMLRQ